MERSWQGGTVTARSSRLRYINPLTVSTPGICLFVHLLQVTLVERGQNPINPYAPLVDSVKKVRLHHSRRFLAPRLPLHFACAMVRCEEHSGPISAHGSGSEKPVDSRVQLDLLFEAPRARCRIPSNWSYFRCVNKHCTASSKIFM